MTGPLWTAAAFLDAVGGRLEGGSPGDVASISIDSRTVAPGAAFFSIRGDRFDGHDYAAQALGRGAAVAVVRQDFEAPDGSGPFVRVDDPLGAMERLAAAARARSCAGVAGVTGSVGKTGTKEMLRLALSASGKTHASPASYNNHWGVPYSLAGLAASARYGVFEMGMNHAGEIAPLSRLVRPHVSLITAVAPVHIAHFASVEEIADAKAEIFAGLQAGGVAVLPADSPHCERLARHAAARAARIVRFGGAPQAEARLVEFEEAADWGRIVAEIGGRRIAYRLGAPGRHLAMNSVAALAVVDALGADVAAGAQALAAMTAPAGRGARSQLRVADGFALLIDESYNANPVSMAAALAMLGGATPGAGGRRIAVLGDMLELGEDSPRYHRELADPVLRAGAELLFVSGALMANLAKALEGRIDVRHAEEASGHQAGLLETVRPGDVVMVKGSLGSRMGPLVAALKSRYGADAGREKP